MSFRLGRKAAQPSAQPLSPTHPLSLELSSLRTALAHYQAAAHQSAIQLQGLSLELSLLKDADRALRDDNDVLKREVQVLRSIESPPVDPPSTQLSELTLAHRRLSAKLDLTETSLASASHELADAKAEILRLQKEKEADRAVLNDLRRIEEDREEEVDWERREKKRAVEEKKLCDLALAQYADIVKTLDPTAQHPTLPSCPDLPLKELDTPASANPLESIAYLLQGQRGVQRLFEDFNTSLSTKDAELRALGISLQETKTALEDEKAMHETERQRRVNAELERDKSRRDDQSAAKVVERYMAFTQKTSQTLHAHLDALRTRSNTTLATLRAQLVATSLAVDTVRNREHRLRVALEQMTEDLSRETFGRRREVVLRLKCVAQEERWRRRGEAWRDRVRQARQGPEGAVMELELAEALLDQGLQVLPDVDDNGNDKAAADGSTQGQDSLARVLLAEDLVTTLVADLQKESERRLELETQRVEWLAGQALAGRKADSDENPNGETVFDIDAVDDHAGGDKEVILLDASDPPAAEESPAPDVSPAIPLISPPEDETTAEALASLQALLQPVKTRYATFQRSLHDCASSLATLRATVPTPKHPKLLSRKPTPPPVLATLLDGIYDVLEDARVEVEIAVADDERVMEGYEAMWRVGQGGSRNSSFFNEHSKRDEVERFVKGDGAKATKLREQLERKVADLEHDLALIKRAIHEDQGMDGADGADGAQSPQPTSSAWMNLPLRTVLPPVLDQPSPSASEQSFDQGRRPSGLGTPNSGRALFSGLGRSFSSAINNVPRVRKNGSVSRASSVSNESLLSPSPADADSDVE